QAQRAHLRRAPGRQCGMASRTPWDWPRGIGPVGLAPWDWQGRARRPTLLAVTEVFFYHLEHQPLERVLPNLVERTLERRWRAVVQAGSGGRGEATGPRVWNLTH